MVIRAVAIHPQALRELRPPTAGTHAAVQRFRLAVDRAVQRITTAAEQDAPLPPALPLDSRAAIPLSALLRDS